MSLHPQARRFLDRQRERGERPDHELTIAELRRRADQPATQVETVHAVREARVAGPAGPVRVRVYHPVADPAGIVLYLHGGGHVTGTLDSYDGLVRRLTNRVPVVVVAVEYRRAPEHRCPAPVDDAEAVYRWILDHRSWLLDPVAINADRVSETATGPRVVIAGDSAGGNNTAVLARRIRDARLEPPALQVLLYPTLDAVAYRGGTRYPSYRECADGYGLTYVDGLCYWDHYLGPDGDAASPDASPLRTPDLGGLAPAYVLTVEYDVLRDEGHAYAARLARAGVPVELRHWPGHLHGFLGDPASYDDADVALGEAASAVRSALIA